MRVHVDASFHLVLYAVSFSPKEKKLEQHITMSSFVSPIRHKIKTDFNLT